MSNVKIEICCGSYYDAYQAYQAGAKRIELNSALSLGGLTPSLASLIKTKQKTDLEVICMVRERGAGFCYHEEDMESTFLSAKLLLENGADGIAFGFLNEDKTIHKEANKKMIELIHSYGKKAVFHRAIDVCNDYKKAFENVVALQVDRILTSGGYAKAIDGIKNIKEMQQLYGDQVEILVGSGIHAENAQYMIDNTGISQLHSSCKCWLHDATTSHFGVNYSYADTNKYEAVDPDKVKALLTSV